MAIGAFGLFVAMFGPAAQADECKVLGSLSKFELAADGKSAQAVVRNTKTGEDTMLTITDELTINRFKNKPMEPGNEIRAHFEKDGKNTCNLFEHAEDTIAALAASTSMPRTRAEDEPQPSS